MLPPHYTKMKSKARRLFLIPSTLHKACCLLFILLPPHCMEMISKACCLFFSCYFHTSRRRQAKFIVFFFLLPPHCMELIVSFFFYSWHFLKDNEFCSSSPFFWVLGCLHTTQKWWALLIVSLFLVLSTFREMTSKDHHLFPFYCPWRLLRDK